MNFTGLNLDLQGVMRRTYANILSKYLYEFPSRKFYGVTRQTGTPMIELLNKLILF